MNHLNSTDLNQPDPTAPIAANADAGTVGTLIGLVRCSKPRRIILAGLNTPQMMFELHARGFDRVATTTTCGLPRGQYDVALIDWRLHSIRALEAMLDWLVHFVAPAGALVIRF